MIDFTADYPRTPTTFAVEKNGPLANLPDTGTAVSLDDKAAMDAAVQAMTPVLKGKIIGVQIATIQADLLNTYFKGIADIRTYKTTEEHDLDLEAGRVDAVLASTSYFVSTLSKPGGDQLKLAGPLFTGGLLGKGTGVGFRKSDTDLRDMFNTALQAAIADGTVKKLAIKWFKFDVSPTVVADLLSRLLSDAHWLRPAGLGLAALPRGADDAGGVRRLPIVVGLLFGTLGAWAKLSDSGSRAARLDVYTTVFRGIPDLLVIYLFYFGGSQVLTSLGARCSASTGFSGLNAFTGRHARRRHRLRRLSDRGAARRLSWPSRAARSKPRAPWAWARLLMLRRDHRAARVALRAAGHGQCLAAGAEGVGADLGHRAGRDHAAGRNRRADRRGCPFDFYIAGFAAVPGADHAVRRACFRGAECSVRARRAAAPDG